MLNQDGLKSITDAITAGCYSASDLSVMKGELSFGVPPKDIQTTLQFLKSNTDCRFEMLIDVCGVDYPDRGADMRFEVVYSLLSLVHNARVRVKVAVGEGEAVPSATGIFKSAGWFEREVWDLFGIPFDGHPDLRRILTDYGFDGHPLRKDFPLTGYVELRYDPMARRVVYEPVQLTQDFRVFDTLSPWEGMADIQLPGDEKGTIPPVGWTPTEKKVNR